jgi:acyl-coenzyme A thioesterase PaaI-like protein
VRVAKSLLTRNLNGTTFGGTIFSAADPFHAVMYWQVLARRGLAVRVWLKAAGVEFLRPASSALTLEFRLAEDDVADALAALERQGRFVRRFRTDAVDGRGAICARIETEVYLRLPRRGHPEGSAF